MKLVGLASVVATAVLGVLPVATVIAAPAYADCGDPGQPPCAGPVPTVDQVEAVLARVFDPDVPAQDKTDVVDPGFSPDEAQTIDDHLHRLNAHGYLPLTFVVTDIQPAPDNLAGATLSIPRPWTPAGPIVLVDQGGHWLITHDTAMTALNALWYNASERGSSPVGPPLPPFSSMPGRLGF